MEYARTSIQEHLPLQTEGYKCSTDDLLYVLLGASVNSDTIESVCADLVTARYHQKLWIGENEKGGVSLG